MTSSYKSPIQNLTKHFITSTNESKYTLRNQICQEHFFNKIFIEHPTMLIYNIGRKKTITSVFPSYSSASERALRRWHPHKMPPFLERNQTLRSGFVLLIIRIPRLLKIMRLLCTLINSFQVLLKLYRFGMLLSHHPSISLEKRFSH